MLRHAGVEGLERQEGQEFPIPPFLPIPSIPPSP
jgi:hypothetical protein